MSRLGNINIVQLYSGKLAVDRGNGKLVQDYDAYFYKIDDNTYIEVNTNDVYSTIRSDEKLYVSDIKEVSKSLLNRISIYNALYPRGYRTINEIMKANRPSSDNFEEPELDSNDNLKETQKVYTNRQKTRVM